jgi:hypothetical protein
MKLIIRLPKNKAIRFEQHLAKEHHKLTKGRMKLIK